MFLLKKDATYKHIEFRGIFRAEKNYEREICGTPPADQDSSGQQCSIGHTFKITC